MIWLRRLLVIPVWLAFMVFLVLTFIIFTVNGTFLAPNFYKQKLADVDIYGFALVDLPASAIEEFRKVDKSHNNATFKDITTIYIDSGEIIHSIGTVLPQSWVQYQVEHNIDQVLHYIAGETNNFEIIVPMSEHVPVITNEMKESIHRTQAYDLLFKEFVGSEVDRALSEEWASYFRPRLAREDVAESVYRVVPQDWFEYQMRQVIDEVMLYIAGDQDGFEAKVQLAERADVALEEMNGLLGNANYFELLSSEVLNQFVEEVLYESIELPSELVINREEIVLPANLWSSEQELNVIGDISSYLVGKTDDLVVVIPMTDTKQTVSTLVGDLVEAKLNVLVSALPECSKSQLLLQKDFLFLKELPQCIPYGIQRKELVDFMVMGVIGYTDNIITSHIPDEIVYDEADLRIIMQSSNSAGVFHKLETVRDTIRQGWIYTDTDLREDLGEEYFGIIQGMRVGLNEYWVYTDTDFRDDLINAGYESILGNLDTFREQIARASELRFLVYVICIVLLILIGVLGGNKFLDKITWSAAALGISAAVLIATSGILYDSIIQSQIYNMGDYALREIESPTLLLATEKALYLLQVMSDELISEFRMLGIMILGLSVVVLSMVQIWSRVHVRMTSV